jgi:hypothetical protein
MPDEDQRYRLPDGNSAVLRYAFAATFIVACLYDLELGVRVAGVFLAGLSIYQGLLGRVPLIGVTWKTTGYLTGAATVVSAAVTLVGMFLIFEPPQVSVVVSTEGIAERLAGFPTRKEMYSGACLVQCLA